MKFLSIFEKIKIFGKREIFSGPRYMDYVSGRDDVLCVSLPQNLDNCVAQLLGTAGRIAFCDKSAFLSGSYRARHGGAGHVVVSAAVAADVLEPIDALRSAGRSVYVAVWAPLNDLLRSQDTCDAVDFWSGQLVRVPSNGELAPFLADLRRAPENNLDADGNAVVEPGWQERVCKLTSSLEALAARRVSLISGFARSHGASYSSVLAEALPAVTDCDLVVLSSRHNSGTESALLDKVSAEIKAAGSDRRLLVVSFGSWTRSASLTGFKVTRKGDRIWISNVPPCVFYEAAGTVYSDDPHVCAEAALHGKAIRLIGEAATGGETVKTANAGEQIAWQLLRPQTCIFDCATQSFISAESLLEKLSNLNGDGKVTDYKVYIDAQTAAVWSERVYMLGQSNYLEKAIPLSVYLSGFHPGENVGLGPVHATTALRFLAGHGQDLDQGLSVIDDIGTFERNLPILLYTLFNEGSFDRLQHIANSFARNCIKRVRSKLTVRTLKRLERSLNGFYELDQLLASFGLSCLYENSRVALVDLLFDLFSNWGKLPKAQKQATKTLSNSAIKLLHREDFDIPRELIALVARHCADDLAYLVSLLNLINNNEIITERNMYRRERIMVDLADHLSRQFIRVIGPGKADGGTWTALLSFIAVGYDCSAIRSERFSEAEKLLSEHLADGLTFVEAAFSGSEASKPLSNYMRALEQLAGANAPNSTAACDMLRSIVETAGEWFKSDVLIQQDLVRIATRFCNSCEVDERIRAAERGDYRMNLHVRRMASNHLFAQGRMEEGLEQLDRAQVATRNQIFRAGDNASSLKRMNDLQEDHERKKFYKSSAELLGTYPQPTDPKGVIFVLPYDAQNTLALGLPILADLRKRGYATHYLGTGILPLEPTGIEEIDKYHGLISYDYTSFSDESYYDRTLKNEWEIDWENKILKCDDVNYYQGVFEYLANRYRRFDIDIRQAPIWKFFYTQLLKCDRAVTICKDMQANPALKGLPVRFMAVNAQISPAFIYKEFCAEVGYRDDMHLVFHMNGYENYFSNMGTKVASTIAVRDMTANPFIRSPLIVRRDMLELPADGEVEKKRLETVLTADRVRAVDRTPIVAAVEERIRNHRASGGKVLVCYGKVMCDLGFPFDGGPAHRDMIDWINHTIECAKETSALLLVKPHPQEKRPEVARHLTQTLFESISTEIPENVILLGHDWFNNSKLKDMMDVAILWSGTSCLEMSVWGVPVIICAHFGKIDYPIELITPKSRSDYERMIRDPGSVQPHPDSAGLAIDYLQKMSGEAIFSPYRFCPRPATNDPVGPYYWIKEDIERWQSSGDSSVARMADEYARKFVQGEVGVATEEDYERYRAFKRGFGTAI